MKHKLIIGKILDERGAFFDEDEGLEKVGVYDFQGNDIIKQKHDAIFVFNSEIGLLLGYMNSKNVLYNRKGKVILYSHQFDDIGRVQKGIQGEKLYHIYVGGNKYYMYREESKVKMGYINSKGEIIWNPTN